MLSKEQRLDIAKKVYAKANATNATLAKPVDRKVLDKYCFQRADAVISALNRALANAYKEVTPAQLELAKNKFNAEQNGNREARRQAKVASNRAIREAAALARKQARIEARKKAALAKKETENTGKSTTVLPDIDKSKEVRSD